MYAVKTGKLFLGTLDEELLISKPPIRLVLLYYIIGRSTPCVAYKFSSSGPPLSCLSLRRLSPTGSSRSPLQGRRTPASHNRRSARPP
jgi:hypothetical protein